LAAARGHFREDWYTLAFAAWKAKRSRVLSVIPIVPDGHCGAFDTVKYFLDGLRRYVVTFIDLYSCFSIASATKSGRSLASREFFNIVRELFFHPLQYVLTDNGSEFMKHFDQELGQLHKIHWHIYPKTPKVNAHVERFSRTT
jgi:transposase InsO family protein